MPKLPSWSGYFGQRSRARMDGFTLVEAMVVTVVLALVAAGIGGVMNNMIKGTKTIEDKAAAQRIGQQIGLYITSSNGCRAMFGINYSSSGTLIDAPAGSPLILASRPPIAVPGIPGISIAGTQVKTGDLRDGMKMGDMSINIAGLAPGSTDWYSADFAYTLDRMAAGVAYGSKSLSGKIALQVHVVPYPSAPATATGFQISDCFALDSKEKTPPETCKDLGGRWLRNPDASKTGADDREGYDDATVHPSGDPFYAKHFMSQERCHMGGELILTSKEAPVGVPVMGGTNDNGERVSECYFNASGVIRTYSCPGGSGGRAGYRCVFNHDVQQWQVRRFATGGAMIPTASPATCAKGVKIATQSPDTVVLNHEEDISAAYTGGPSALPSGAPVPDEYYYDHLNSVELCNTDPTVDSARKCINPADPDGARAASAGSCVWVSSSKPMGTAGGLAQFSPPLSPSTETSGWVWVPAAAYASAPVIAGVNMRLRSARGYPCQTVSVNASLFADPALSSLPTADGGAINPLAATTDLAAQPNLVQQCVFLAKDSLVPTRDKKKIFSCDNSNLTPGIANAGDWLGTTLYDDNTDGCACPAACKATGKYDDAAGTVVTASTSNNCLQDYACNPVTHPEACCSAAHPEACYKYWENPDYVAGTKINGTKGLGTPQLTKGSCWYFKNVRIANFFNGNSFPVEVQGNGHNTFTAWNRKDYYTGWVWLATTLPDSKFKVDTAAGETQTLRDLGKGGNPNLPVTPLTAVPCTGGIRYSTAP